MAAELEAALQKIRPHKTSSVAHQKAPATLLGAVETTFKEQNTERSPTAYFAALLTTLDSTVQKERAGQFSLAEGDLLPAELYLLALVAPHVPPPVLRTNLDTVLSLTAVLWPSLIPHAPPLRSQLSMYNAVLLALDRSQLEIPTVRQSFATILQLVGDSRPKVRRKAADLVRDVLESPPSPLVQHPYTESVAEWSLKTLAGVNAGGVGKQKGKKSEADPTSVGIHILSFLRPVLPSLPSSCLPQITNSLLSLPRLGNPFLSQSAYLVLSQLLSSTLNPEDPFPRNVNAQISQILKVIISSPPVKTDNALLPSWLQVVGNVVLVYSSSDNEACALEVPHVWKVIFAYLESKDSAVRRETAATLDSVAQGISHAMIESAVQAVDSSTSLTQIVQQVTKALDALPFARAIPEVLSVVSTLIKALRYRPGGRASPTAAELLLLPLIQTIGDLRVKKGFEHKEAADNVLRTAMSVVGPEALLSALPLNLEPADRASGMEPRAFLLPLLTVQHPSPLQHFVSYFVPLTEGMFNLQQNAETEGRGSEAKMWSVLVSQIWNGLPEYCRNSPNLQEALTPQLAQMLSQLLYNQPELRPAVLKALIIVVQSNVSLCSPTGDTSDSLSKDGDVITVEEAAQNVEFIRSQAESWLAVLFNVFSSVDKGGNNLVGDAIGVWASVTKPEDIAKTCRKVGGLFKTNLEKGALSAQPSNDQHSVIATTQDILVLLLPYYPAGEAKALFNLCLSTDVLTNKDNGVQKRGYKLLYKLVESGKVDVNSESTLAVLEEVADETAAAAKRDRLTLIKTLITHLSSTSLHVIPSLIPEAVLGTKEPSEKARTAAFELIVEMGNKMSQGGIVKRSKLNGMDDDSPSEATASIEEYLTMVAGGLAGATPHMISATVTAISRLVFEFKDTIPPPMLSEIFTTLLVFLTSTNREIVKSTLGFIKLAIHTLPVDLMHPHLKQLVTALLGWSHDHKNHFKDKVRHVFERMIRRFGWEDVYASAGEDEASKFLLNIKKRKDRAKRKKAQDNNDESDEEAKPKVATGNAFEDVLYGSESEGDKSDDEHKGTRRPEVQKRSKQTGARLRIDDDEPMDLLHGVNTRLTTGQGNTRRKPGQDASKFKTDEESGKMVIDNDSDSDDNEDRAKVKPSEDVAGAAYYESLTSADGFTRGPNGRIKFNKDTKKRRRENDQAGSDVEMADATPTTTAAGHKKAKRDTVVKLGREFKAKKAGGDVKKGGVDPYAYLPLGQAAKKKGKGHERIAVIGKR
ncbi:NUC173-domain-containing protein [Rickenella mellea]|uniref:NUC173-domain-containing protein n=1 Tax=Rickenella mellea TaxID=50990 RepID=A0A4Y7QGA4_9AGAM|nr:NUC173-domain-containing protein [Rickenella mellea]